MTTPDRVRVQFSEISSRTWEHPADRTALVALRSLSGFDTVLKVLSGLLRERQHRLLYLASAVRVDDRQFRRVNQIYSDALAVLDVDRRPELYVMQWPMPTALTIGMDTPFIVVSTGLLDLLDDEELRFCLGHEIGHAQSGHAVYRTMLMHLMRLAGNFGWMPLGGWALRAMIAALMEWSRKSELSGDRAGLLAGQDVDAALRVQMKMAGGARLDEMDTEAFLAQAAEYDATGDLRDGVLKLLNLELQSHPFSVLRAAELKRWVDSGEYERILAGDYPRRGEDSAVSLGDEVRSAARTYKANFDVSADPLIRTIRDTGRDFGTAFDAVGQGVADTVNNIRERFGAWRRPSGPAGSGESPWPSDAPAGPPPSAAPPTGTTPTGTPPTGTTPTGTTPTGTTPTGTTPTGTAPTGTAPTGTAPTGTAPTGTAPTGTAPTDTAPTGTGPTDTATTDGQPATGSGETPPGAGADDTPREAPPAGDPGAPPDLPTVGDTPPVAGQGGEQAGGPSAEYERPGEGPTGGGDA
jgi:Zn-dependent protease with chaperone function